MTTNIGDSSLPQSAHKRRDEILWALVPVKQLDQSKRRLKHCLGDHRHEFSVAMLKDLLNALVQCRTIPRIAIVTADRRVKSIGKHYGALVVNEAESGNMNLAVRQGVKAIHDAGGTRVAVFPADIPLVTAGEIDRMIQTMLAGDGNGAGRSIGICPSADQDGTNFLYLDTAGEFSFGYGPGSYQLHLSAASEATCRVVTFSSATISLDIDRQTDLDEYISYCVLNSGYKETESWRFLRAGGFIERAANRQRMRQ